MKLSPLSSLFRLTGRISKTSEGEATLCWPGSMITCRFFGTKLSAVVRNENFGAPTIIGAVVDGEEKQFPISYEDNEKNIEITIAEGLEQKLHDAVLYKRMEGHYLNVLSFETDGEFKELPAAPKLKIEVYGDSVSAGSVVDCEEFAGKSDPEHNGQWDNAWHAYPQIIARELPAEVYDTSQGGIAIFDGTGYFEMPNMRGMESCWDKVRYSSYKPQSQWDFSFKPDIIIFAIGQNDANPDPEAVRNPEKYEKWVEKYIEIINNVRSHSENAAVILALTVLMHDPAWDGALDDIASRLGGDKNRVRHFRYSRCGKATPGHPRYCEQKEMAEEMCGFIRGLPR